MGVSWSSKVLVLSDMNLVHLLLMSLKGVHLVWMLVISDSWRSIGSCFVKFNTLVWILQLLLDSTRHLIWVIVRKLGREHEASIAICGKWFLIITDFVEGKLHLSCNNKIVSILDSHFSKTFRLSSYWLFSLDIDVHFFFLNKFSQFKVLYLSKDSLHQDLKSLVRANLDIERFIQFVV